MFNGSLPTSPGNRGALHAPLAAAFTVGVGGQAQEQLPPVMPCGDLYVAYPLYPGGSFVARK